MKARKLHRILPLVISLLSLVGCRMCANPYDHTGPVLDLGAPMGHRPGCRAGSILCSTDPGTHAESTEEFDHAIVGNAVRSPGTATRAASARALTTERGTSAIGRPFTREEIEPFIDLGIPPENIISISDRPLSEVEESLSLTGESESPSPVSRDEPTVTGRDASPKQLLGTPSFSTYDGWTRLGTRTSTLSQ